MKKELNAPKDLSELLLEFFSVKIAPDSDAYHQKGWHIQDLSKFKCPKCLKPAIFLVCTGASSAFEGACLFCQKESIIFWSDSLSVDLRNHINNEFNIVFDSTEVSTSWPAEDELRKGQKITAETIAQSTNSIDESTNSFAPKGFRQVGWLREEEARAIIAAYETRKTQSIFNQQREMKGEARYYSDGTAEVEKYKSNVHLVRLRRSGERWVGWIRLEEAQAILQALENQSNVTFGHKEYGKGGEVHFFPPESEMAKRFLSQTRLLRRS